MSDDDIRQSFDTHPDQVAMPQPGHDDHCRKALAFVVGLEGPEGKRLPLIVFQLVMDMLVVRWDPLRKGPGGGGWGGGGGGGGCR